MNEKIKNKSAKVLGTYRKVGTKFVPPLLLDMNLEYVSWTTQTLPELIWWDVLADRASHRFAANIAEKLAAYFKQKNNRKHWWAFISDYSDLSGEQMRELRVYLSDIKLLPTLTESLNDFLYLYPSCPIANLCESQAATLIDSDYLVRFENRVGELENKRSRPSVLAQAQAIYMAFISDRLHVRADLPLADFPEVEHYPHTEKSMEVGASICAAVNMLAGELPKYSDDAWAQYFWQRSLEIRPLNFSHLEIK